MSNFQIISRQPLIISVSKQTSLSDLHLQIRKSYVPLADFVLKYEDEEGDFVTFTTEGELQEAFREIKERNQLSLKVQIVTENSSDVVITEIFKEEAVEEPKTTEAVNTLDFICQACKATIVGIRYKCGICADFDLCAQCESLPDVHNPDHPFLKIRRPLPPTFQSVHVVASAMHQCGDQLSYVQPQINAVAESTRANFTILKDEVSVSFQQLSEQFIRRANDLKNDLVNKYGELKTKSLSDVVEEIRSTVPGSRSSSTSPRVSENEIVLPPIQENTAPAPTVVAVTPVPPPPATIPEAYFVDLQTLREMGFLDADRNLTALLKHNGDMNSVLSELMN